MLHASWIIVSFHYTAMAISQRRARQGSQLTLLTLKRILLALVVGSFIVFVSNIYCFHLLRNTNILQTQFQLPAYEYYEYHQSPDELNKRIEGNDDSSKNEKRSIRIRILKERAHRMMQDYSKRGLVLSLVDQNINNTSDSTNNDKQPAMEHFKITKFQLSPNHIAGFDFQYVPVHDVHARSNGDRYPIWTSEDTDHARNIFGEYDVNFHEHPPGTFTSVDTDTDTDTKDIRRQCEKRERFICRIDMNKKNIKHFAHFAQSAFPCFSALQIARDRTGHTRTHTHTSQNFETAELINVTVPHPHPHPHSHSRSQSFILQIILPDQNNLLKQILQMWWRKDSGGGVNQKSWAEGFLNACELAGINVSMVTRKEFNIDKADSANGGLKEGDGSNPCDWRVERMQKDGIRLEDSGWPYLQEWRGGGNNDNDTGVDIDIDTKSKQMYPIANSKYFSRRKDMDILQRYVLGREYSRGPSLNLPIRVLMLDRKGATRQWIYSQQTKALLESTWNGYDYVTMQKSSNQAQYNHHHDHDHDDNHDHNQAQNMLDGIILDARVIPNPSGTLLDQAREIHNADIIIASHGAALTNLAFIRPCTAVIELLPYGYYLGFFQPLVLAGDGISFDAYLFDGMSRVEESLGKTRGARRAEDLRVSPESIERALPGILLDVVTCRENWTPSY